MRNGARTSGRDADSSMGMARIGFWLTLFLLLQASRGPHGAAPAAIHLEHNGSLPHPQALADAIQQQQQQPQQVPPAAQGPPL